LNDSKTLANLHQKQAAAKITVDRLQKRNEIIARIERLKIRIPIAKYTAAQAEHRRLKEARNELKARVAVLQNQNGPLKVRSDNYEARRTGWIREYERANEALAKSLVEAKKCEEQGNQLEDEMQERENEIMRIKKRGNKRQSKLAEMRKDITKLEHAAKKAEEQLQRLGPDTTGQVQVHFHFSAEY
jgi:chromosome segregation ATPase